MQDMYLFITVTKRDDSKELTDMFMKRDVMRLYSTPAKGTAKSQILDIFGLEESEKTVHHTVVTHNKTQELLKLLKEEFRIDLPDRGIAMSVPLSGISTLKTLEMFSGGHAEDEMAQTNENKTFENELIIAICNKGYASEVMEAARKAGSSGGTILHAKGTANEYGDNKFFGMSIVDEKEIIYIVAKKSIRSSIMQAITDKAGKGTKAHAIVFSLPVSQTAGM